MLAPAAARTSSVSTFIPAMLRSRSLRSAAALPPQMLGELCEVRRSSCRSLTRARREAMRLIITAVTRPGSLAVLAESSARLAVSLLVLQRLRVSR